MRRVARRTVASGPEMVPLASLTPWPGNPRINDEAAKRLAVLIQEHGFVCPVVVWGSSNIVYAGCTRLKAGAILGLIEVPVIRAQFRDEEQAVAFALADNKSGEWAAWDEPALALALGKLESVDVAEVVRMTGFEQQEIEGIKTGWEVSGNDPAREWEGMPEYEHEDQTSFRHVVVHFARQEDVDRFAALVGQVFTERTRSIWFPPAEIGTIADKRYGE